MNQTQGDVFILGQSPKLSLIVFNCLITCILQRPELPEYTVPTPKHVHRTEKSQRPVSSTRFHSLSLQCKHSLP